VKKYFPIYCITSLWHGLQYGNVQNQAPEKLCTTLKPFSAWSITGGHHLTKWRINLSLNISPCEFKSRTDNKRWQQLNVKPSSKQVIAENISHEISWDVTRLRLQLLSKVRAWLWLLGCVSSCMAEFKAGDRLAFWLYIHIADICCKAHNRIQYMIKGKTSTKMANYTRVATTHIFNTN
jgi:hypothetical protein